MSNLLTLKDATDFVGRFVEAGSCDASLKRDRVNEACRRLMVKADWYHTIRDIRIRVDNLSFPLPRDCAAVRWARVDNEAVRVNTQAYEYMASGPGDIKHMCGGSGIKDLLDNGSFCTMYDIPSIESWASDSESMTDRTLGAGYQLLALATDIKDVNQVVTLYGMDRMLKAQGSGAPFTPGEDIKVARWGDNGTEGVIDGNWVDYPLSTKFYRELTGWKKPVTAGYIWLYAVNTTTNAMFLLAVAHPDDTRPTWRRYKLTNMGICTTDTANIRALCKLQWVKMTRDDDILPIQNLEAIKFMVIAIRQENAMDIGGASAYEQTAIRLLAEQQKDIGVSGGTPVIIDIEPELSYGGAVNSSILL